jgi:ABC-2 type transport system permease protein
MTLWRMELLRITRTERWAPSLAVFLFFGITGPLVIRYRSSLFKRVGGGIKVILPKPVPADAIGQFLGNAQTLGLLAVVILAAGALAFDAHPEVSAFFRTRVEGTARLLAPKFALNAATAIAAFLAGLAVAWILTTVLLGNPSPAGMLEGAACWAIYLCFAVALVAVSASIVRTQLGTVLLSLGTLIALPILGLIPGVNGWLPTSLANAPLDLLQGTGPGHFLRATVVTVVATPIALWAATRLADRREL